MAKVCGPSIFFVKIRVGSGCDLFALIIFVVGRKKRCREQILAVTISVSELTFVHYPAFPNAPKGIGGVQVWADVEIVGYGGVRTSVAVVTNRRP